MKLVTFNTKDDPTPRLGVVVDEAIVDLRQSAAEIPADMLGFLRAGDSALDAARAAGEAGAERVDMAQAQLLAPIMRPGKVLAIGLNYADHIGESGMEAPKHQVWFNKQRNCINAPYAPINLPAVSSYLDYEAELCLVIGRRCKHVPRERATEVIAGYCCGNDVSVRDWQMRAQTMQIGKSFDTHGPLGPYLVTPDEVGDPHTLGIRGWVNGELRQESNTEHLIFDCFDAIAHLTQAFTLDVGDVLFMGTPAGVGAAMKPPQFLKLGDVVKIEIDKLGFIENTVVAEDAQCLVE